MDKADLSSLRIDRSKRTDEAPPSRRKRGNGWIGAVIALVLIAAAAGAAWKFYFNRPVEVELATARLQSIGDTQSLLSATGYVVAQRSASVGSKATGLMVELRVREGDAVREGDIIARLQDNDIRAMLAEAEANLALSEAELAEAKNNLDRQQSLFEAKMNAQVDLDRAQTAHNRVMATMAVARARIEAAKVELENTIIRAPFDGTVLTKNADVGEIVTPMAAGLGARAAVVSIADLGSLQVEADVSESNIQKIQIGMPAMIRLDAYPTREYRGKAVKIIPTADRAKGTVMVKIGFDDYDTHVLPEMSARVTFLQEDSTRSAEPSDEQFLTIPGSAVAKVDGKDVVYRVRQGRAEQTPVELGESFGSTVAVRQGLDQGDQVVLRISENIKDGVAVKVQE